jgi:hypothetical protein
MQGRTQWSSRSKDHVVYYESIKLKEHEKNYATHDLELASIVHALKCGDITSVNVYAIVIVLFISIDKRNIRTRSLRNTHSQETQHLS